VRLIKGGGRKRCNCKKCGKEIYSSDWKYVAVEGVYCVEHGRVESLHSGFVTWLSGVLK